MTGSAGALRSGQGAFADVLGERLPGFGRGGFEDRQLSFGEVDGADDVARVLALGSSTLSHVSQSSKKLAGMNIESRIKV